jgi:hypothetical protein
LPWLAEAPSFFSVPPWAAFLASSLLPRRGRRSWRPWGTSQLPECSESAEKQSSWSDSCDRHPITQMSFLDQMLASSPLAPKSHWQFTQTSCLDQKTLKVQSLNSCPCHLFLDHTRTGLWCFVNSTLGSEWRGCTRIGCIDWSNAR